MSPDRLAQRRQILRYLTPFVTTAVAAGVTRLIQPMVAPSVTPPFILCVAIAALYAGRGPGVLGALLSVAALNHWFFPPFHADNPADLARLIMFAVVALVTALIAGAVHDSRRQALDEARENERLRLRAEEAALEAEMAAQEGAEALVAQQHAETALRRSEVELSDFFDTASIGLHWAGEDGTILRANQAELDMLGYQPEEYVGHNIREFHVDQPAAEDILNRLLAGEIIRHYPARMRRKDGEIRHVELDSSGYFHEGRFVHTRCFTRDVTEDRSAREASARLAAIVTSSSDAVVGKTLEGIITSWNAAAERIFGYTTQEMVGEPIFKLIPPEHHDEEREILDRLRQGIPVEAWEAERVRKDGKRIWISLSVSPVRDADGTIIGAASIKRDITDRKLLDERLRDAQRLQSVGQLAGGIAHEANNQMSVVMGGAHFLLRRRDLPESARADVEQIRQAAERTAAITQQLLAFSRRQRLQIQDVNLNEVVQNIGPVLRRSLTEDQELIVRLGLLGGTVRADPRQLEQVMLNLTLNAKDAMPEGGKVTLETREMALGPGEAAREGVPPGHYETLLVSDTGRGMDRATLEQVFEPFFTTKEVGRGTGLGLSVVHGIVTQLGGQVRVQTAPGQGTTFKLFFPLAAPLGRGMSARPSQPHLAEPGQVALVVEDDDLVRAVAARALAEAGYHVLEAGTGNAALEAVRGRGRLDLVLTDIGMPGMDGYELARRVRDERPGLPVVFMTGYTESDNRRRTTPVPGTVIAKPFSPDDLIRAVQQALDQPAGEPGPTR